MFFPILISIILCIVLIPTIINNPFIGLVLFTIMLYIPPATISPQLDALHLTRLTAIFIFIIVLLKQSKINKKSKIEIQTKLFWGLIAIMYLSISTSIWRSNTISGCQYSLRIILGYYLITKLITSPKNFSIIIWTMLLSSAYVCISSVQNYQGFGRLSGTSAGMFANANDLALCCVMSIPFAFYFILRKIHIFKKLLLFGLLALYFNTIFLTQSRGAFVSCAAMLIMIVLKSKKKFIALILAIVTGLLLFNIIPDTYKDRIFSISTAAENDVNSITRLDAWKAGFDMMRSRIFGVGLGNFEEGFVVYRRSTAIDVSGLRRSAHNAFVQIGGELGFPGLTVFILMIFSSFNSLVNTKKKLLKFNDKNKELLILIDSTFLCLFGFCVTVMFLSQAYNWFLYYLIAFSILLERFANDSLPKQKVTNG